METGEEVEAHNHRGLGLCRDGLDDISDYGDRKDNPKDLGPI